MAVRKILAERNTRKLRVAAYIRVSSDRAEQDDSYEAQYKYYSEKIQRNDSWVFAGAYAERESGTHIENRDEFRRMMRDADAGKIDLILVKSVSRWARNIVEGLRAVDHLTCNRVHIIFEQESIDTRVPGHKFQLNLAQAVAQTESESLSENLKWLYRKRAENGIFKPAKNRYFGYNTDDGKFTPDENAVYVRQMYREFAEGKSAAKIVKELEGVVTNNYGNPISASQVKSILTNEIYKGDVHICKTISRNVITREPDKEQYGRYVKNHHPAIVGEHLWAQVQMRFKESAENHKNDAPEREEDILVMVLEGMSVSEIAEYLGLSREKVRYSIKRLRQKGKLPETTTTGKKQEMVERCEKVYAAVRDGHGDGIAELLGMEKTKVNYALEKLEEEGRIHWECGYWEIA